MTDNLRDRIEAAIGDCEERFGVVDHRLMADAVIEALGLTRVTRSQNPPIHRYVTEWQEFGPNE